MMSPSQALVILQQQIAGESIEEVEPGFKTVLDWAHEWDKSRTHTYFLLDRGCRLRMFEKKKFRQGTHRPWFYRLLPTKCVGNDPTCPCQDGDACHYKGKDPWPIKSKPAPVGQRPTIARQKPKGKSK